MSPDRRAEISRIAASLREIVGPLASLRDEADAALGGMSEDDQRSVDGLWAAQAVSSLEDACADLGGTINHLEGALRHAKWSLFG